MARASGSRGSRSERKAGRERAERARARGLPEARPVEHAWRAGVDPGSELADVTGSAPAGARRSAAKSSGRSALIGVVGAALLILALAYILARFRDGSLGAP